MKSRKKMTVNQMVLIALAACINTAADRQPWPCGFQYTWTVSGPFWQASSWGPFTVCSPIFSAGFLWE